MNQSDSFHLQVCFALCCCFNCAVNGLWLSTNILCILVNPHILWGQHIPCLMKIYLFGWFVYHVSCCLIYFIIPQIKPFQISVCWAPNESMLFNYLLKCVGDDHNQPVMAVPLSEEQLQYVGVEGLAPGPLYKRIFCLNLHKAIRSAFASNLIMPFFPLCCCLYFKLSVCLVSCCFAFILIDLFLCLRNVVRITGLQSRLGCWDLSNLGLGLLSAVWFCLTLV